MDTKQSNCAVANAMIAACSAGHIDIVRHILIDSRFSLSTFARCLTAAEGRSFNPFAPAAEFDAAIVFAKLSNREIVAVLLDAAPPTAADLVLIYSAAYGFTNHFKRTMPRRFGRERKSAHIPPDGTADSPEAIAAAIHEFHIQTINEPADQHSAGIVWNDSLLSPSLESSEAIATAVRIYQVQTVTELNDKDFGSIVWNDKLLSPESESIAEAVRKCQVQLTTERKEAPGFERFDSLLSPSPEAIAADVLEFQRKEAFAGEETFIICDDIPGICRTEEHLMAALNMSDRMPKCADDSDGIHDISGLAATTSGSDTT